MRRYKKCFCMNNSECTDCNSCENILETKCNNVSSSICNYENDNNDCDCGFDEDYEIGVFPENPMLAQSYVPIQYMDKTFKPEIGLKMGTIFPELVSPYMPCQSMRTNEFLEASNTIGEECNNNVYNN